jgi:hypothetical protein
MTQLEMVFTDDEKVRQERKTEIILRMLMGGLVLSSELKHVTHRFSACVDLLRKRGYDIEVEKLEDGDSIHRLKSYTPKKQVTDAMKVAYYASEHWRSKRSIRLLIDEYRCCHCRSKTELQVHHWKYDLFNEALDDLSTLCNSCHERIHTYAAVRLSFPSYVSIDVFNRLTSLLEGVTPSP